MIYFGIPLRSKASSNNWEQICLSFNRTLWSVYNQTNPSFKIIVVCHEIPNLLKHYDERVEFIQVNIPFPENLDEQMCDKGYKVHTIGKRIREMGGGFTMIVDADDLYSNRIAQFVIDNPNQNGWVMKTGYEYIWFKNHLKLSLKHPPQPIVNYKVVDLPYDLKNAMNSSDINAKYIIRKGHGNIEEVCKQLGRPLQKLPFIAHIYVKYHGDNHSVLTGQDTFLRRFSRFFMPKIDILENVRKKVEFSIDWI